MTKKKDIYLWFWKLAPAIDVNDDVLELVHNWWFNTDAGELGLFGVQSFISSFDECSGDKCFGRNVNSLAWSGCNKTLDGRRFARFSRCDGEPNGDGPTDDVSIPGIHTIAFGDAWIESIPESPACKKSLNIESRRSYSMSSTFGGNIKLWPPASPRGESFYFYLFSFER